MEDWIRSIDFLTPEDKQKVIKNLLTESFRTLFKGDKFDLLYNLIPKIIQDGWLSALFQGALKDLLSGTEF